MNPMEQEPRTTERFAAVTSENFEAASVELTKLVWNGDYKKALPLADRIFAYRSERGDRDAALVNCASNYYSAASRLWKEGGVKTGIEVGKYMNTSLRALQERIERELEKQGGKKDGMIPVSLDGMSANQLDVMQTVYRQAGEMADRIPLIKPLRQLLSKEKDPVRDFDAAALIAIRAGLKHVDAAKETGKVVAPHTEIFLRGGAFDIAQRYGWKDQSTARAQKLFSLGDAYPWPPEDASPHDISQRIDEYGQAARVARHLRDIARAMKEGGRAEEFGKKAEMYAAHISDQKAKL